LTFAPVVLTFALALGASEPQPSTAPAAAPAAVAAPAPAAVEAPKPVTPAPDIELPRSELPDALKDDAGESMTWALFRTFVVLGLVIMIVWLSLNFGLRRLVGLKGPLGGASVVTVLERIPLDQKRALFVVKAAGEYLLLGSGEGNLGLVAKLDAAEVEKLMQRTEGGPALSPLLARLLSKKNP
jgi:flagellar biogenesis protein FliO